MVTLIEAMRAGRIAADPAIVISNNPAAGGLGKAEALGVATRAIDHRTFGGDRAAFDAMLQRELERAECDIVACAGFMRIMTDGFVAQWAGRMLNIHPSLLPLFKGLDTHARALSAGMAIHGCTVHEVVPELDSGRILGQAAVPVMPGDTAEMLAARVLVQEHRLYPAVLARFVQDPEEARRSPVALLSDET
jgi:phosphoribosylglycinamide formyltransferase-1